MPFLRFENFQETVEITVSGEKKYFPIPYLCRINLKN